MFNKKIYLILSFSIIIISIILTMYLNEQKYYHVFFHLIILSAIILTLTLPAKDVLIIILLTSTIVWLFGFFDVLSFISPLLVETLILIGGVSLLIFQELQFKIQKEKMDHILSYKEKEIDDINDRIRSLNIENNILLDEIKKIRKEFSS